METSTSPAVIVLLLAAAVATFYAWWLSIKETRRLRRLVAWIKTHHSDRWQELPRFARRFNMVGGVQYLRRHGFSDPEFVTLYQESRQGRRRQMAALFLAMALIGIALAGVRFFGWTW